MAAEAFFHTEVEPEHHAELVASLASFIDCQPAGSRVALVASGGTLVPLEQHTVRFIDNFSGGRRGAASAEAFLEQGYSVVFFHRKFSLRPYERQLGDSVLDRLVVRDNGSIGAKDAAQHTQLVTLIETRQKALTEHRLLELTFKSVTDYLYGLRDISQRLNTRFKRKSLLYLAAAVSDFYIPTPALPTHKIQSREGTLDLQLLQVPKMLGLLATQWAPSSLLVTFKLETDAALLKQKAVGALAAYGHSLVVANLLPTRHTRVDVYRRHHSEPTTISVLDNSTDLEPALVAHLKQLHGEFASSEL
eukprot:m.35646 g.35646  ORF g.35646 m.35646 type:complete len:305 (-) comp12412_c0_seq1:41-955(-)